jgi:hypothetical protein
VATINGLKFGDLASAPGVNVLRQSHPSIPITTNTATTATNSVRMAPPLHSIQTRFKIQSQICEGEAGIITIIKRRTLKRQTDVTNTSHFMLIFKRAGWDNTKTGDNP